ncbi:hypothetical protein PT201_08275 [Erysipelothrix rhusiopathiae]|nr:hypothetical protein [Erysipelothrix rhusiopathiae]
MKENKFVFVEDSFINEHKEEHKLMQGTEGGTSRPFFYALEDPNNNDIMWVIPISSRVTKYKAIYNQKIASKGVCDTLAFANVLGVEKTFLIQNMFPIRKENIKSTYKHNHSNVQISISDYAMIKEKVNKVLDLAFRKRINITFTKLSKMYNDVVQQLNINNNYDKPSKTKSISVNNLKNRQSKINKADSKISEANKKDYLIMK